MLISTVKKAEDSDEAIVRLVDLEGKDKLVKLESFKNINQAELTNLIEATIKPLPSSGKNLQINLGHNSIETIKIKTLK